MVENPARSAGQDEEMHLSGAMFVADDMVPVRHFDDDLWPADYRTRSGANLGVGNERLSFGERRGDLTVDYFYRQDWLLKGNRDSVDAHYLDQQNLLTSANRSFDLDYSIRGFAADGLRLAFAKAAKSRQGEWGWGVAVSLLHGYDVRLEEAKGTLVSTLGSGTMNGARSLFNSRLRAVSAPSGFNDFSPPSAQDVSNGWGYAMDLGMYWRFQNGAELALAANDLLGRIKWSDVPLIEQNINGTFVGGSFSSGTSAVVSGSNRYQSLNFHLKPKLSLEGQYPYGNLSMLARLESVDDMWFPQVGVSYQIASRWRLGLQYESRFGAVEISLRHPKYFVSLSSQNLNLDASRALGLAAGLNFTF